MTNKKEEFKLSGDDIIEKIKSDFARHDPIMTMSIWNIALIIVSCLLKYIS